MHGDAELVCTSEVRKIVGTLPLPLPLPPQPPSPSGGAGAVVLLRRCWGAAVLGRRGARRRVAKLAEAQRLTRVRETWAWRKDFE